MATRTRAVVNKRSETQEGVAGWAWHVGQEEGAGKQGLSPTLLSKHQVGRRDRDNYGRVRPTLYV